MDPIRHYVIFGWKKVVTQTQTLILVIIFRVTPMSLMRNRILSYTTFVLQERKPTQPRISSDRSPMHQLPLKGQIERIKRSYSIRSLNLLERIRQRAPVYQDPLPPTILWTGKDGIGSQTKFKPIVARPSDPMDLEKKSNQSNKLLSDTFSNKPKDWNRIMFLWRKKRRCRDLPVKLIAFYLPHSPISWKWCLVGQRIHWRTNVSKAFPQFEGTPASPAWRAGFLWPPRSRSSGEAIWTSKRMAFMVHFHYYLFSGKRLLRSHWILSSTILISISLLPLLG